LAEINHATTVRLAECLSALPGCRVVTDAFFNEFTLSLPKPAAAVVERLVKKRILGGVPVSRLYPKRPELANLMLVAATECTTEADMDALVAGLKEVL
jgi:glycine dehydrogenase subunit 1